MLLLNCLSYFWETLPCLQTSTAFWDKIWQCTNTFQVQINQRTGWVKLSTSCTKLKQTVTYRGNCHSLWRLHQCDNLWLSSSGSTAYIPCPVDCDHLFRAWCEGLSATCSFQHCTTRGGNSYGLTTWCESCTSCWNCRWNILINSNLLGKIDGHCSCSPVCSAKTPKCWHRWVAPPSLGWKNKTCCQTGHLT